MPVLDLLTPEGWKAELTWVAGYIPVGLGVKHDYILLPIIITKLTQRRVIDWQP